MFQSASAVELQSRETAAVVEACLPASTPVLSFDGVTKRFAARTKTPFTAVEDLSFGIGQGEFVSIVGPSGCGKSTVLNLVAGLDRPTEGRIALSGEPVTGPNMHVGFMLQKDLLLPWRSILRNVEFGLEARPIGRAERRERALRELTRCRLQDFANHYPFQLSGGMRQRAALARTLAIEPDVVLLDEPFSALDAQTKLLLQRSFARTIHASGVTTLLITHDLAEAVAMSDRILVMSERPGRIVEEIALDLPHRDDPIARQALPRAREAIAHLFQSLHLAEREA
ncbi:MAG TPA: ABC transporter ATP-binding protein [Roseomonas sp.]